MCVLSKILINDPRSTICKNIWNLNNITNVNILSASKAEFRNAIKVDPIPENDKWRAGLLDVMLETRKFKTYSKLNLNKDQFDDMLESLCIS